MSDLMVDARGIGKRFRRGSRIRGISLPTLSGLLGRDRADEFWALKDIDLQLRRGESLGIIGPNGAGKSTLLKILSRVTAPTAGTLKVWGRVGALIEVGAGFHPELSGRDNVYINGAILGMSRREITRRFDEIVAFAELEDFIDTPVKKYSSGMYVRLGFAVAAHMDPDILLVDEILAVGDGAFQKKCFQAMTRFKQQGVPFVLVSHSMYNVQRNCSSGLLLLNGQIKAAGEARETINIYQQYLQDRQSAEEFAAADEYERACTKNVVLTDVRLLDAAGRLTSELQCADPLFVELDYETKIACEGLHVEVAVYDAVTDVQLVTSGSYLDRQPFPVTGQRGSLRCAFPRFSLTSGDYLLQVMLLDETGRVRHDIWRGHNRSQLRLRVKPDRKSAWQDQWRGVVDLETQWEGDLVPTMAQDSSARSTSDS